MIAIFGGTTEGRIAAQVCDKAAKRFIYSTKGDEQQLVTSHAQRFFGALDAEQIIELITQQNIKLIIDAAHPFAQQLHSNIAQAAQRCKIDVIRFERAEQAIEHSNIQYFDSLRDVIEHIKSNNIENILSLTGVKSSTALSAIALKHNVFLRIMDRESSNNILLESGFPEKNVIYYNLLSSSQEQNNYELCGNLSIKAIVTKESGKSGGFEAKVEIAKRLNIQLLVIKRPCMPQFSKTVYGEFGLRRAIEELLPCFFELHTGFTTGSAATAAAAAALNTIINGYHTSNTEIILPNGEPIEIASRLIEQRGSEAKCCVVKDGGDDPDITHQIEICATVQLCKSDALRVEICGGVGVGRVTLPGIGIEVGQAAINPTPRAMIEDNISRIATCAGINELIKIKIEVPQGEMIGAKTFNPRLGILGGISILGTSGIVQPFSAEAFLEAIDRQINIVKALGHDKLAINSGAMSERYIKAYTPNLPQQCYVHYGNLIGATIQLAAQQGIKHLYVGCMIGKAVKLAKGMLDTHSKKATIDRDFILELASQTQCSTTTKEKILKITTARELWNIVPTDECKLFEAIAEHCFSHCKSLFTDGVLEFILIGESGNVEAIVKG
ncbi:MAG: cobalt-precorrin-5B (C(1))-methyltransferase CbiD [Rikenellaceae bacterium]